MQTRGADDHTGQQFAENCGEFKTNENLSQSPSSDKDQDESENAD